MSFIYTYILINKNLLIFLLSCKTLGVDIFPVDRGGRDTRFKVFLGEGFSRTFFRILIFFKILYFLKMRGQKFLKIGPKSRFFKIERKIFGTSNMSKTHFQRVFRHLRPKNFQVLYEIFFEIGYVKIEKVKKNYFFVKHLVSKFSLFVEE